MTSPASDVEVAALLRIRPTLPQLCMIEEFAARCRREMDERIRLISLAQDLAEQIERSENINLARVDRADIGGIITESGFHVLFGKSNDDTFVHAISTEKDDEGCAIVRLIGKVGDERIPKEGIVFNLKPSPQ